MKRSNGGVSIKRLQVYLKAVMLRRTKDTMIDGKPIFVLPSREVHVIKTDFDDQHERDFYMGIKEKSNVTMNKYVKAGTVMQNITNILTAILRMRQACDHPHISTSALSCGEYDLTLVQSATALLNRTKRALSRNSQKASKVKTTMTM